jgi:hypothetical protein
MAKRLKWGTIEYLNVLIDEYFTLPAAPTIAGLQIYLKISDETWKYYISERWRTHRKSPEEVEAIEAEADERYADGAFEELLEISSKCYIGEDKSNCMNIEEDNIKSLVSASLKKAKQRIDAFVSNAFFTARNPAGAIFYAKSALGYRETTPEQDAPKLSAGTINIIVMPQTAQPVQAIDTTYSVLPSDEPK